MITPRLDSEVTLYTRSLAERVMSEGPTALKIPKRWNP